MTDREESPLARTRRARRIVRELGVLHPDARCALNFTTPLELLVATILSAQTTDKRVNENTPRLFARYPDAAAYAAADRTELEDLLRPLGFFRAKAQSLIGLGRRARRSVTTGEVPGRLDELVKLPGVGRKTANVVLGHAFGIPGITVDTHVGRLARRMAAHGAGRSGQSGDRPRRADPAQGVDDHERPADLSRPADLPLPQARLRRLRGEP